VEQAAFAEGFRQRPAGDFVLRRVHEDSRAIHAPKAIRGILDCCDVLSRPLPISFVTPVPFDQAFAGSVSGREVKKLRPPVTAARLMVWKREWAAISADAETAQFQARASAGQDVGLSGR
jgi:hypothetical protein